MKALIHTLETVNGPLYLLQEGKHFTPVTLVENPAGLSGIFSKGGFFDKVISTASGVFKKEDGTPTFIGESIKEVASSFGDQLALQLAQKRQSPFATAQYNSLIPGPHQSQLPAANSNPLPDGNNNTIRNVAIGVIGTAAVGTAIYFATKK